MGEFAETIQALERAMERDQVSEVAVYRLNHFCFLQGVRCRDLLAELTANQNDPEVATFFRRNADAIEVVSGN